MKIFSFLTLLTICFSLLAQTATTVNNTDSISHIEIYGETGKGDTAIIFFNNGNKRTVLLPDEKSRDKFLEEYKSRIPDHKANSPKDKHRPEGVEKSTRNIIVPKEIAEYTYNNDNVQLRLRNGKKEFYDLTNPAQRKSFMVKYHNFLHLE